MKSTTCARTARQKIDPTTSVTLTTRGGLAWADSREVAKSFEKRHDNVLRDIEALRTAGGLLKTEDTPWFTECGGTNSQNSQTYRYFEMTRDGFSLLAMGWTGAKALAFKVAYIDRFNAMEAALKAKEVPALPDFSNPVLAARAWADEYEADTLKHTLGINPPSRKTGAGIRDDTRSQELGGRLPLTLGYLRHFPDL